jgi:hypothetical protein
MAVSSVKRVTVWIGVFILISGVLATAGEQKSGKGSATARRSLTLEELDDKVRGGWAGQMIGVTYGAPTEFRFQGRINEGRRDWKPEELKGALDQDDLYVEMTFAAVMDRLGLEATTQQYGEAFRDSKYRLWHANLAARRL